MSVVVFVHLCVCVHICMCMCSVCVCMHMEMQEQNVLQGRYKIIIPAQFQKLSGSMVPGSNFVPACVCVPVQGRRIRVTHSQSKHRLFVGHVPKQWNKEDLQKALEETGPGITTLELLMVRSARWSFIFI